MKLRSLMKSSMLDDEFVRLRHEINAMNPAPRHILVMGASGGEGVSMVALHLALALRAEGANRVLLAEGNLRYPSLAAALRQPLDAGLLTWDMESELPVCTLPGGKGLCVLLAGTRAESEEFSNIDHRLDAACHMVDGEYDYVVWDAPALTRYSDGLTLAARCDGVLVVIEMDESRVDNLRYLRTALERSGARILGSVLNRAGRYLPRPPRRRAA